MNRLNVKLFALLLVTFSVTQASAQNTLIRTFGELNTLRRSEASSEKCKFKVEAHLTFSFDRWTGIHVRMGRRNLQCDTSPLKNPEVLRDAKFADLLRIKGFAYPGQDRVYATEIQILRSGELTELEAAEPMRNGKVVLRNFVKVEGTVREVLWAPTWTRILVKGQRIDANIMVPTSNVAGIDESLVGSKVMVFGSLTTQEGESKEEQFPFRMRLMDKRQIVIIERSEVESQYEKLTASVDFIMGKRIYVDGIELTTENGPNFLAGHVYEFQVAELSADRRFGTLVTARKQGNAVEEKPASKSPHELKDADSVNRLVRCEGTIKHSVLSKNYLRLYCVDDDNAFIASLQVEDYVDDSSLLQGNRIEVTGLMRRVSGLFGNAEFLVLTDSREDIKVLSVPIQVSRTLVIWMLSIGGALSLAGGVWYYILNHQVKSKTRELSKANARLIAASGSVRDAILVFDADMRVIQWNSNFAKICPDIQLNESQSQVAPRIADCIASDHSAFDTLWSSALLDSEFSNSAEFHNQSREIWTTVYTAPVAEPDGANCGRIWTFEDVTNRKRVEEEYLQSQKINAVGRLAGGVAHDFNNLLQVINSHLTLLSCCEPSDDQFDESLSSASMAVDRAANLTKQLLAFSRRRSISAAKSDVNLLVTNVFNLLHRTMPRNVDTTLSLEPNIWPVEVDAGQIEQVVMNLCLNARDAIGKDRGCIRISTGNHVNEDGWRHVLVRIKDDGCGMDSQTVKAAFEPFFTTKPIGKGTGLGLSMAHGTILQHGGLFECKSRLGEGTQFDIRLPIERSQSLPQPELIVHSGSQTLATEEGGQGKDSRIAG